MNAIQQLTRRFNVTDNVETVLHMVHDEAMRISGANEGGIVVFQHEFNNAMPVLIRERIGTTPPNLTALDLAAVSRKEAVNIPDFQASAFVPDSEKMRSGLVTSDQQVGECGWRSAALFPQDQSFDPLIQD